MSKEQQDDPFISIEFEYGQVTLDSIEDAQDWVIKERTHYAWLQGTLNQDGNLRQLYDNIFKIFTTVNQHASKYIAQQDPTQKNSIHNHLKKTFNSLRGIHYISSESPGGNFVTSTQSKHGNLIAAHSLAYLMEVNIGNQTSNSVTGILLARDFKKGSQDTLDANDKTFSTLRRSWSEKLSATNQNMQGKVEEAKLEIELFTERLETLEESYQEQIGDQIKIFSSHLNDSIAELQSLTETYDKKMAVQSSVKYWRDKYKKHRALTFVFGSTTLAVSIGFVIGFYIGIQDVLTETFAKTPLWKIGFTLALSSMGVWLTRLSSKIFISNLHLMTDAEERVTMTQTYLALLREDNLNDSNDRQLILQTLFRPSTDGFIKEDSSSHYYDLIGKQIEK